MIAKFERDHIIGTIRRTCSDDLADRLAAALAREQEAQPAVTVAMIEQMREHYEQALASGRTLAQVRASLEAAQPAAQEPSTGDDNDLATPEEMAEYRAHYAALASPVATPKANAGAGLQAENEKSLAASPASAQEPSTERAEQGPIAT